MHKQESAPLFFETLSPGLLVESSLYLRDQLPYLPTMIATRLQLELLLQESIVDLSVVSEVILSDAGATLQIFRLMGEENPDEASRPTRIEECIVSLNLERWSHALTSLSVPHNSQVQAEWQYCRRVAESARNLAECVDGFSPEEAYVIGLLSELGKFPYLLGWNAGGNSASEHQSLSVMLAEYWQLPPYLLSAIREQQEPTPTARWTELLFLARRSAQRAEAAFSL